MMLQIKTVTASRNDPAKFDKAVNYLIAQGWELVRRYVGPGFFHNASGEYFQPVWVAEMQRQVPDEKV